MRFFYKFLDGIHLIGKNFPDFIKSFLNAIAVYAIMMYMPLLFIIVIALPIRLIIDDYDVSRIIFNIVLTVTQIFPLSLSLAAFDEDIKKEQGEHCSVFVFVIFAIVITATWII